jgi:integrase
MEGSRIDEICRAMVADIVFDQGIHWLHVRLDNRLGDSEQDAEIKTENSERTVPIHAALIEEGFLKYVDKAVTAFRVGAFATRIPRSELGQARP